ncbi:MAG TPA: rod shape-determining protein RodA [Gaiellales bacterium]
MTHYLRHLDYLMLATVLSISAFGLWILQTATKQYAGNLYGHQLVYVVVGVVGMMIVAAVPPALMRRFRWPLYAFVLLSTAAVLAAGTSVGGGKRWINLGAFQLQPSEFAKLLLIVGLAAVLAARRGITRPSRLTLLAIVYIALPAALVFKEPDFGTTLVFVAIMLGMLFVYGIPWQHFVWMAIAVAVTGALVFSILPGLGVEVVHGYQISRLTDFLHPNPNDTQGNGFQERQSVIAVSHGGLGGTGTGQGAPGQPLLGATQTSLGFLPEAPTDFVFSVVGEERGFVGAAWLICLYALLLWRGLKVVTKSRSTFGSLVAAGVVSMLLFQIFINIGMTIGLAPVTGIPLPFMSFGGSHTITNLLAIGVLQAIHVHAQTADDAVFAR